jgi:hypothetical protein
MGPAIELVSVLRAVAVTVVLGESAIDAVVEATGSGWCSAVAPRRWWQSAWAARSPPPR